MLKDCDRLSSQILSLSTYCVPNMIINVINVLQPIVKSSLFAYLKILNKLDSKNFRFRTKYRYSLLYDIIVKHSLLACLKIVNKLASKITSFRTHSVTLWEAFVKNIDLNDIEVILPQVSEVIVFLPFFIWLFNLNTS